MTTTRRQILEAGGVILAGLTLAPAPAFAAAEASIRMAGTLNGSAVWFDPIGLLVRPGTVMRWTNTDLGNSHTTTACHPANGYPLRIPAEAQAWDSGYLLPHATFEVTLTVPGVYDYVCRPHEHAGMVGRVIVMPDDATVPAEPTAEDGLAAAAIAAFPTVEDIMRLGVLPARNVE